MWSWPDVSSGVAPIIAPCPDLSSLSLSASEMSLSIPAVGLSGIKPELGYILVLGL